MSAVALSKHTRPISPRGEGELDFDFDIDVEEPAPPASPEMPLEPQSMRSAILQWLEELA